MRAWCKPARSMAARIASSFGACENLTWTRVPPRKSMPRGMPCQNSIEHTPARLKTSEKARKNHFLPRKSMFGLRKNSTLGRAPSELFQKPHIAWVAPAFQRCPPPSLELSDAESFASLMTAEHPIKNHARDKHCGKQIRQQPEGQCGGKPFDRAGAEHEQDGRRNDGGDVGVDDRNPGVAETLFDGRGRRFAVAQLLADALKNQHIRIHAHAHRQDDAGDSGKG